MRNKINICHISDLHFGIFENKSFKTIDEDFHLADSLIDFISTHFKEDEKPHFLLISGDLTSISKKSEYKDFLSFIDNFIEEGCFARCYFKKYSEKDRIIIVPGNHDVVRELDIKGKYGGDKIETFKKNIAEKGFNTPYGNDKGYCFEINDMELKRLVKSSPIPCALYYYPEYNIMFLALVSCYLSQKYNPIVLKIYEKFRDIDMDEKIFKELEKDIEKIIYDDFGHYPQLYWKKTRKTLKEFKKIKGNIKDKYRNLIKFAITHHQVIPMYSKHVCPEGALEMREILGKYGVVSILHGHLHNILEERYIPEKWNGESSFLSCGTVAAYCPNTVNKFNMIEIRNYEEIKKMRVKVMCYEINSRGCFKKENAYELYSNVIRKFLKSLNDLL